MASTYRGIAVNVLYFTPPDELCEVWQIEVENRGSEPRRLKLFPFLEPQCNWSAMDDAFNLQYNQYIATTRCEGGIIDIASNINMPEDPERFTNKDQKRHTYFALAGIEASGFEASLEGFLGPHGTYARPQAVERGKCAGTTTYGDMPAAAFEVDVSLAPGEKRLFAVVFGIGRAETEGREAVQVFSNPEAIATRLEAVKTHWGSRLSTLQAETPDAALNSMINTWSPYNNLMTFYWSRTASLVYAGERDGFGFRDTLQDFVGSSSLVPDETRERLELMLTGQFANGGCKPVVQPFAHHPGHEREPENYRSDDALWFFNAIPAYVKETGNLDFFDHVLPFADKGEGTVLEHLRRAIGFNLDRSGVHGLPCGLHADWNDCLRLGQRGESVFVAFQLRLALREYVEICTMLGRRQEATWAEEELVRLDRDIATHTWDGEWYLRAYREDGLKFGSRENSEGRIFMNPQAWAVLSGHATGARARQVLDAMHEHLATDYGVMLCAPPYVTTDPEVCLARLFNPGTKENAGVFNHPQGWAVLAAAAIGDGDRAFTYLRNVLPARFNDIAEIRQVEPYVVCQSTHSRFSPQHGNGRVSWLSGSAVWKYVAMTQGILGIQPDYNGLRLQPCLPSDWSGYRARRIFRGATYEIEVSRSAGEGNGGLRLEVNGETLRGNLIPPAPPGETVRVLAEISDAPSKR
jgi:cellobiose phosphorylase